MALKDRQFSTQTAYRHGYQGSERDAEALGGFAYTTEYRMLDVRLGRWFSTDPITHYNQSSYCSMDNNPVVYTDRSGQDGIITVQQKQGYTEIKLSTSIKIDNRITQEQFNLIKNDIDRLKYGDFETKKGNTKYVIVFEVTLEKFNEEEQALFEQGNYKPTKSGDNYFSIVSGEGSKVGLDKVEVKNENKASNIANVIYNPNNEGQLDFSGNQSKPGARHEVLHFFGLWDRYKNIYSETTGKAIASDPDEGYEGDAMGDSDYNLINSENYEGWILIAEEMIKQGIKSKEIGGVLNRNVQNITEKGLNGYIQDAPKAATSIDLYIPTNFNSGSNESSTKMVPKFQ